MAKLLASVILALVLVAVIPAQRRTTPKNAPPPVQRGPYTLPEILDGINAQRDNAQIDIEDLVRKRGVTFQASPELEKVLRDFGASEGLLQLIPKTPLPPPTPTAGELHVLCKPIDCEVVVNNRYYGPTQNGSKNLSDLKPGNTTIAVFRDGYLKDSQAIVLKESQTAERTFNLQPNRTLQEQSAQRTFIAVVTALGGLVGIDELQMLPVAGTVEFEVGGTKSGATKFTVGAAGLGKSLSLQSESGARCTELLFGQSAPECKGRKGAPDSQTTLATDMWRRSSLPRVLSNFLDAGITVYDAQGSTFIGSQGQTETCSLKIDSRHRPIEFTRRSNETSALVEQIQFADYTEYKNVPFARKVIVTRAVPNSAAAAFAFDIVATPTSAKRK